MHPFANFSVIKFHSLYGNLFDDKEIPVEIKTKISQGVRSVH